jgi:hypothetical protein
LAVQIQREPPIQPSMRQKRETTALLALTGAQISTSRSDR